MIKIICVGKIKEKFLVAAIEEYIKRISKYTKIEIIELPDYDINNKELVLEREKENIIKYINSKKSNRLEGQNYTNGNLNREI